MYGEESSTPLCHRRSSSAVTFIRTNSSAIHAPNRQEIEQINHKTKIRKGIEELGIRQVCCHRHTGRSQGPKGRSAITHHGVFPGIARQLFGDNGRAHDWWNKKKKVRSSSWTMHSGTIEQSEDKNLHGTKTAGLNGMPL